MFITFVPTPNFANVSVFLGTNEGSTYRSKVTSVWLQDYLCFSGITTNTLCNWSFLSSDMLC